MIQENLRVITQIIEQKDNDIAKAGQPRLDSETLRLAEHKRFTFDVITTPTDPLR